MLYDWDDVPKAESYVLFDKMHRVLFIKKMQFWSDLTKSHILSPHWSRSSVYWHTLGEPMQQLSCFPKQAFQVCRPQQCQSTITMLYDWDDVPKAEGYVLFGQNAQSSVQDKNAILE